MLELVIEINGRYVRSKSCELEQRVWGKAGEPNAVFSGEREIIKLLLSSLAMLEKPCYVVAHVLDRDVELRIARPVAIIAAVCFVFWIQARV